MRARAHGALLRGCVASHERESLEQLKLVGLNAVHDYAEGCDLALRISDIPWAKRQLWDSDVAEKDGKYYLYFSAKDKDDVFRLGVAVSDKPEGPFIPDPEPIPGSYSIDPCAFKDDDGSVSIAFGGLWGGQLQRYRDNVAVYRAAEDRLPVNNRAALEPLASEPFSQIPDGRRLAAAVFFGIMRG